MTKPVKKLKDIKEYLSDLFKDFRFDVIGFATKSGKVIPLNLEPGTLGNIIEGVIISHLKRKLKKVRNVSLVEGGHRKYPDIELSGKLFGNKLIAFDIKAARRNRKNAAKTQSRITLYTFGTYLKHQERKFPQTLRPFADYSFHIDLLVIFDVKDGGVENFELLVVEPWRVASKTASSATRDYVGAVMKIDSLRDEKGEFTTRKNFYDFWKKIPRRGENQKKS